MASTHEPSAQRANFSGLEKGALEMKIDTFRSDLETDIVVLESEKLKQNEDLEKKSENFALEPTAVSGSDVIVPLEPKKLIAICVALAISIFLISIDETVIVTAIPNITDDFKTIKDIGQVKFCPEFP